MALNLCFYVNFNIFYFETIIKIQKNFKKQNFRYFSFFVILSISWKKTKRRMFMASNYRKIVIKSSKIQKNVLFLLSETMRESRNGELYCRKNWINSFQQGVPAIKVHISFEFPLFSLNFFIKT